MTKKIKIGSLEELISQPRLVKYDTYEFDELSYTCLLMDIRTLIFENKIYKEVINKALKLNEKIINMREQGYSYEQYKTYLLKQQKILKEVE